MTTAFTFSSLLCTCSRHLSVDNISTQHTWPRWWYMSEFSESCLAALLKSSRASSGRVSCIFRLPRLMRAFDRIYANHSKLSTQKDSKFILHYLPLWNCYKTDVPADVHSKKTFCDRNTT